MSYNEVVQDTLYSNKAANYSFEITKETNITYFMKTSSASGNFINATVRILDPNSVELISDNIDNCNNIFYQMYAEQYGEYKITIENHHNMSIVYKLLIGKSNRVSYSERGQLMLINQNTEKWELFFPLGWYTGGHYKTGFSGPLKRIKEIGMNCVIHYGGSQVDYPSTPLNEEFSNYELLSYLNEAWINKIKVFVGFQRNKIKNRDALYISERVDSLKNHPALLGWYLADEPEQKYSFVENEDLEIAYRLIKENDESNHPVVITFSSVHKSTSNNNSKDTHYYKYSSAYDVLAYDRYYISVSKYFDSGEDRGWDQLWHSANATLFASEVYKELNKMSTLKVLQAHDRGKRGENIGNWDGILAYPNYHELKYEVYTSLIHSTKGVIYFSFYRCNNIDVRKNIERIWEKIKGNHYINILFSNDLTNMIECRYDGPVNTKDDSEIHGTKQPNGEWKYPQYGGDHSAFPEHDVNFSLHKFNSEYYLFVVNDSNNHKNKVTFTFPFILVDVKNFDTGLDQSINGNNFIFLLNPYDSVVFLIKARDI